MMNRSITILQFTLLVGLSCLTGCGASWLNTNGLAQQLGFGTKLEQETADNPVTQLIPVWTEGEGPGIKNQAMTRGFAGQVYFITENRGLPSEVKGGIRVYLFDDQGTEEEQAKPIYQFDFEPTAWQLHSTMTKLGPAYSLFIPYTRPGRHLAQCALRIRYTPPSGPAVFSEMATLTLPGVKKSDSEGEQATAKGPLIDDGSTKMKTTRIDLTDRSQNSTVKQVSAEEPQRSRKSRPVQSNLQSADYETPENSPGRRSRVQPADYEVEDQRPDVDVSDVDVNDVDANDVDANDVDVIDREHPFGEIPPESPAVRTFSIPLN